MDWPWVVAAVGIGALVASQRRGGSSGPAAPSPVTKIVTVNGMRVLVHVPAGLRQVRTVLYLHGHGDKIERVRDVLLPLWDKAKNPAIIIAPQLGPLSEPGPLANSGALASLLKAVDVSGPVAIMAHSGGYLAAAILLRDSKIVTKVGLLDALYGEVSTYRSFLNRTQRFINVYGPSTEDNSILLLDHFPEAVWLNTTPLNEPDLAHMLQFKISTFATSVFHPNVPAVYGATMIDGLS